MNKLHVLDQRILCSAWRRPRVTRGCAPIAYRLRFPPISILHKQTEFIFAIEGLEKAITISELDKRREQKTLTLSEIILRISFLSSVFSWLLVKKHDMLVVAKPPLLFRTRGFSVYVKRGKRNNFCRPVLTASLGLEKVGYTSPKPTGLWAKGLVMITA